MTKKLVLSFKTAQNKNFNLSFKYPKENLTKDDVKPIANKIIETKIFNSGKRELATFNKVYYVSQEKTSVE